jgi:hypothetical protein
MASGYDALYGRVASRRWFHRRELAGTPN